MRKLKILQIVVLVSAVSGVAFAEPFDFFGSGSRQRALSSGVASSQGPYSAYYNPAFISSAQKPSLDFGFLFANQGSLSIEVGGRTEKSQYPVENVMSILTGFAFPIGRLPIFNKSKILDHIWLGLVGYLPTSRRVIRISGVEPQSPSLLLWGNRNTRFSIYSGISAKIPVHKQVGIFLGAGIYALAELPIYTEVNLLAGDQAATSYIDGELLLSTAPVFGGGLKISIPISENTLEVSLGSKYRGETGIQIPLRAQVNSTILPESVILSAMLFDVWTPSQLGFGGAGSLSLENLKFTISGDYVIYRFSTLKIPILELQELKPEIFSQVSPKFKIELEDVAVLGGGFTVDIGETIWFGGGFSLFPSPLVSQQDLSFVDADRTIISAGVGFLFKDPFDIFREKIEFNLSGQYFMISSEPTTIRQNQQASVKGNVFSAFASLIFRF